MSRIFRQAVLALAAASLVAGVAGSATAQRGKVPPSAQDKARAWGPIITGAHLHHIHLNVTDRKAAIAFYTKHFKAIPATFAGEDAVWVQRSWILLTEVPAAPSPLQGTAVNHFGWGAPDAKAEFARQKALGASFQTELRDIGVGLGGKPDQFYFMYVQGPDGAIIELNTDDDSNFGHIHMASADPLAANHWYRNMFGITDAPPYFPTMATPTTPGAIARSYFDNVMMILIKGQGPIRSTRGSVVDHVGVSVPNLDKAMAAARSKSVTVLEGPSDGPKKLYRHAFIEGPDKMVIELIEDHAGHPPITD